MSSLFPGIPDNPEEANIFYEQYDDFDDDDVIDSEDTLKHNEEDLDLIPHLEAALNKRDNEGNRVHFMTDFSERNSLDRCIYKSMLPGWVSFSHDV